MIKEKMLVVGLLTTILLAALTMLLYFSRKRANLYKEAKAEYDASNGVKKNMYEDIYDRRQGSRGICDMWFRTKIEIAEKRLSASMVNYLADGSETAKRDMVKHYTNIHNLRMKQLKRHLSSDREVVHLDAETLKEIVETNKEISKLNDVSSKYSNIVEILKETDSQLTNNR